MHSGREDGELSDGDGGRHPPLPVKVNGGPPPTSSVQHNGHGNNATTQKQESHPTFLDKLHQDRESARQFIKLLHSHNIPYRTLADEKLDAELLRGLYQSVNLPSEPAPILPPKPNNTASSAPAVTSPQHKVVPALKTSSIPAPSTKSIVSPTAPGDRKDYIARLQAAKAAKQAGSSKPMSPAQHPLPPKPNTPQPVTTPTAKPPVTDEQRARNTELIKQRLEAIKAKQKAPSGVSNGAVQRGEQTQAAEQAPSSVTSPTTQNYAPTFSGIPGLFMNNTPASSTAALAASQPSPSVSQKLPISKAEVSTSRESTTPYTRPLGQSTQDDDSMIIEVSEDESNGSDMDIEDDQPAPQTVQTPRRNLLHFAHYAGSAAPATPADSTSGVQTPSTLAREKELVDKEKQLVAMRETLKKKLAEKRERDRLASAAVASSPSVQKPSTPVLHPQGQTPSKLPTPMMDSSSVSPRSVDPARSSTPGGKGTAQSRRAEIQSRLPTLDAEIASNTSRMAELTKELEKLTALNNRIAKDKEQLTKELESLGVDTEGMSHAQLRAKKDEIEREQSPAPNVSPENADRAPQSAGIAPPQTVQTSFENASSSGRGIAKTGLPGLQSASNQHPQGHVTLPGLEHITPQAQPQSATNHLGPSQGSGMMSSINGTIQTAEEQLRHEQDTNVAQPPSGVQGVTKDGTGAANADSPTDSSDRDMDEDFYSTHPPFEKESVIPSAGPTADTNGAQSVTQSAATPSPSEGETEMSVSEGEGGKEEEEEEYEPEYEPEEPTVAENMSAEQTQKVQPEVAPSASTSHVSAEGEEAYEPPTADQDMTDAPNEEVATQDSGAQAGQAEPEDGAMDIATSSDESSDDSDSDDESDSGSEVEDTISGHNFPHQDTNIADDLAPELQSRTTVAVAAQPVCCLISHKTLLNYNRYLSPRNRTSRLRSSRTKARFACSNHIAITHTLPKTYLEVSCR